MSKPVFPRTVNCNLPTLQLQRPDRSTLVCSTDAEITYKSADGVLFRIHRLNLEACTEGLSPPEGSIFEEIVELTEDAPILELLFQFIYPTPGPDLTSIDFNILESLAEAAEKYQVYTAMSICKIYMMFVIDSIHLRSIGTITESPFVQAVIPGEGFVPFLLRNETRLSRYHE